MSHEAFARSELTGGLTHLGCHSGHALVDAFVDLLLQASLRCPAEGLHALLQLCPARVNARRAKHAVIAMESGVGCACSTSLSMRPGPPNVVKRRRVRRLVGLRAGAGGLGCSAVRARVQTRRSCRGTGSGQRAVLAHLRALAPRRPEQRPALRSASGAAALRLLSDWHSMARSALEWCGVQAPDFALAALQKKVHKLEKLKS